jgi:hypothetical protein
LRSFATAAKTNTDEMANKSSELIDNMVARL